MANNCRNIASSVLLNFFQNIFFQNILSGILSVSNGLKMGQNGHSVRPNLDPNCLTLMVFLKEFFNSLILKTFSKKKTTKKAFKTTK